MNSQVLALAWLCLFFFALLIGVSVHDAWVTVKYNNLLISCSYSDEPEQFVPYIDVREVLENAD